VPGGVTIQRLGRDDAAELERFASAFDGPPVGAQTRAFLEDPRHHLLVAEVDGEPAGFVSAVEIFHPDKPPELFLNELGVVEHLRRRGAATALIDALTMLGREIGAASIWVLTDEANDPAMRTYRGTGGVRSGGHQVMFEYDLTGD
jgi:ribosomal protein S18 acetylase RimI-like enzyme